MANSRIDNILKPVSKFIHQEFTGGIILFSSVVIAILWVNSPWGDAYHHVWDTHLSVGFAGFTFNQPLHVWINDGLMALFFFVIGLELKREFMAGELSTKKKAALPMVAAFGGMLVPALIFLLFNHNLPSAHGWGIPMATDIAFALGLLSLAGKHIPSSAWVAFVIMPVFALANAGMHIGADFFSLLSNPLSLGILLGLVAGKFIGVLGATWLMVRLKWAELPKLTSWRHIIGVAFLAGVGFTMSLFITGLAFDSEEMVTEAKYGILLASLLSGIAGILFLKSMRRSAPPRNGL